MILTAYGLQNVGAVTGKQALCNLRKGPGASASVIALENPDKVKSVFRPLGGTFNLPPSDFSSEFGNTEVVPNNQGWQGGRVHSGREGCLVTLGIIVIDLNTERGG